MARPVIYTPRKQKKINKLFQRYIEETEIPILSEFAVQIGLYRQALYDMPILSDTIKKCSSKKEAALERKALEGKVNTTMAIFSLKQLGWRDDYREAEDKGDDLTRFADMLREASLK